MQLDIKKAFLSPFSGKGWFWKVTLFSVLAIIAETCNLNISRYSIIGLFLAMLLSGYSVNFIHNEINNINPILPAWRLNLKKFFKLGIVSIFMCFIYFFISLLVIFPLFGIGNILKTTLHLPFLNAIAIVFLVLFFLLLIIAVQFGICAYSKNYDIADCFKENILFKLMLLVKKEIFITILIALVIQSLGVLFSQIMTKTNNIYIQFCILITIPYILSSSYFIPYNLSAQIYKIANYRHSNINQNSKI